MTGGQCLYLISLLVSIHGRPNASIAAIFRQSSGFVLRLILVRKFVLKTVGRVVNCSQVKFVAIILVLSVLFDFSSDPFDFASSKTG